LILNAIEAMPRGGNITIETIARDEHVEIKISDNGIGIPAEDLNKIYNPYYTTKKRGFGLGLSLVHSVIYKHSGKISVKSEKGKGTEFVIIMPVDFSDE
jgi:signal transduction histidine kinase